MAFEFITQNAGFFIFILVLMLFLYIKKHNLHKQGSFPQAYMLLYKTKLGLDKMDKWSKKHPKTFLYLGYLSIFIGVVGAIVMIFVMIWQLGFILDNDIESGGGLVLPIKTDSSFVFYVPFWHWLIAIAILMIVHEFAHGVIAQRFGIKIKSSGLAFFGSFIVGLIIIFYNFSFEALMNPTLDFLGLMLLGVIFMFLPALPGAFVEPDEKILAKKPRWQQIAVMGAGSTSNFLFGILFFLIWLFLAIPLLNHTTEIESISFAQVLNESELKQYDLEEGQLLAVNGNYSSDGILSELQNLTPNQSIELTINSSGIISVYNIKTYENPEIPGRGMIGIAGLQVESKNKEGYQFLGTIPNEFERLMFWVWLLNIAIGMVNLLPIWITDGGQIARVLFTKYFKEKTAMRLFNSVSIFSLLLIIFTIFPSTLKALLGI